MILQLILAITLVSGRAYEFKNTNNIYQQHSRKIHDGDSPVCCILEIVAWLSCLDALLLTACQKQWLGLDCSHELKQAAYYTCAGLIIIIWPVIFTILIIAWACCGGRHPQSRPSYGAVPAVRRLLQNNQRPQRRILNN